MNELITASNHLHLIHPEQIILNKHVSSFDNLAYNSNDEYKFVSISPLFIKNNDIVTVIVKVANTSVKIDDWIGAYVPDYANIQSVTPVKFGLCSLDANYLRFGESRINFNFTNHRSTIRFHLFKGGFRNPVLVASSKEIITFKNINEPLRNRIIPTGDPNVYQLLWSSFNSTEPIMKWNIQSHHHTTATTAISHSLSNNYSNIIKAFTTSISKASLCSEGDSVATTKGWLDLGQIHIANITGILSFQEHSDRYLHYIFGDAATNDFSEEFILTIPPKTGDVNQQTQVVLLADLGVGVLDSSYDTQVWSEACPPALNTSYSIGHWLESTIIDAVFHSGDISYANGYLSNWDYFMNMIAPIAGRAIYMTTLGNHESVWPGSDTIYQSKDSGGECGVLSTAMLPLPYPATANKPWWSYNVGLIHFIGMGTEHDYRVGSFQYKWLENDLQCVNRTLTPWVVFSGHRPMYVDSGACCGWGIPDDVCNDICLDYTDVGAMRSLQQSIESLLYKYRVNLAFAGHFHNAQRQSAVYKNKVIQKSIQTFDEDGNIIHYQNDPSATVWMVIGSAGNGPSYSNKVYPWSEASWDNLYGYAILTAVNATYLSWKFINSATDEIIDRLVITQDFASWELNNDIDNSYFSITAQVIVATLGVLLLLLTLIVTKIYNTYYQQPQGYVGGVSVESGSSSRSYSTHGLLILETTAVSSEDIPIESA